LTQVKLLKLTEKTLQSTHEPSTKSVGSYEQCNEHSGSIKEGNLTSWYTISFSRRSLFHGTS